MSGDVRLGGRAGACVAVLTVVHQRPDVKLSHLHARPYSLRQDVSLIPKVHCVYLSP